MFSLIFLVFATDLFPLIKASPPVVHSSPVSILNVVVFPAPFTPNSPKHSPGRTPRHSLSTARIRPIFLDLYTWGSQREEMQTHDQLLTSKPQIAYFTCRCRWNDIFNLCQVVDLQHVIVSISSQHSSSLTGYIYIIIFYRLATDRHPPGHIHKWILMFLFFHHLHTLIMDLPQIPRLDLMFHKVLLEPIPECTSNIVYGPEVIRNTWVD